MEKLTNRFIQICIIEKASCKMQYYCEYAPKEVGGVLEIDCNKDQLIIKDVIILEQEASSGDFYLDDEALAKFTESVFIKNPKKMEHIKGWWHKHPIEGWSGHDDETFKKLREYFKGFVFGIVMRDIHKKNNKFSPLCRLEVGKGELTKGLTQIIQYHTPHIKVIKNKRKFDKRKLRKKCKKEVEKLVKERVILASSYKSIYDYGDNNYGGGFPPFKSYGLLDDEDYKKEEVEPQTDISTARILKKAGLVWDADLGYYVHKSIKGLNKPNLVKNNDSKRSNIKGQSRIMKGDGYHEYLIWINNERYDLKKEVECTFVEEACDKCPYKDECILQIKERKDRIEKDYLDYFS